MKRVLSFILLAGLTACIAMAQDNYRPVKGYVVDENGNPIPGAEVMATGGGESVITDADGSFKMDVHPLLKKITASYSGMNSRTLKTKFDSDMIFTLKPKSVHNAFLNVIGGYNLGADGDVMLGLMGGVLGKWGYYGKADIGISEGELCITAGVIKSIYKMSSFLYLGIGYGDAIENAYYMDGYEKYAGGAIELGDILRPTKHFNISIGYNLTTDFDDVYNHTIQAGVGYVF